jgi:eukaryotic-like serine/threonine-protein kinase
MTGTRIGPYEVVGKLGEGGMGEVYRAHDARLGRDVAIKVLPTVLAADPERVARFEREARTLAVLNHPHIAQIFGVEDHGATRALVMELVEGATLAEVIAGGSSAAASGSGAGSGSRAAGAPAQTSGIGLHEALPIARQVAEGLEAAHEAGIVHRDLKPANIKVRPDGTVKILDFGLAKLAGPAEGGAVSPLPAEDSPTLTSPARLTLGGGILGTAAYMSPEQARGRAVDRRADIWAFGCVLFEMLAGRRAFRGETMTDLLAAIVQGEPDWAALPHDTPPQVRALLIRCLQKDPRQRLRDIGDARWELERAVETPPAAPVGGQAPARRAGLQLLAPWAAAILGLAIAALAWSRPVSPPRGGAPLVLSIAPTSATPLPDIGSGPSVPLISPDGSAVLFWSSGASSRGLHVRRLDSLRAVPVPGAEVATNEPFWSPDSSAVLYPSAGAARQIVRVRLPDGAPEAVMPLRFATRGGSVSDDGTVLVSEFTHLTVREPSGSAPVPVETASFPPGLFTNPHFLPGGDELLVHFTSSGEGASTAYLARLRDGALLDAVALLENDTAALFTPAGGGQVLFVRNDNLYAQRLDRSARALVGAPALIVTGVASQPGNTFHRADFSVARNGTVAWRPGRTAHGQVTELDREGRQVGVSGPPASIIAVVLAPDDTRLLARDLQRSWLLEVGRPGRFELSRAISWVAWTQSGSRLIGIDGQRRVVQHDPDSPVEPTVLGELPPDAEPRLATLSPDGAYLLWADGTSGSLQAALLHGGAGPLEPTDLGAGRGVQGGVFSPDGRWIVYAGMAAGDGIYVQPFPGPSRRRQVARAGHFPVWRQDGKEIVYVDREEGAVWSIAVAGTGDALRFAEPVRLFGGLRRAPGAVLAAQPLGVSSDGSRFFIAQGMEQPDSDVIHVMIEGIR